MLSADDERRALDGPGAMRRALPLIEALVRVLRADARVQRARAECLSTFKTGGPYASEAECLWAVVQDMDWGLQRFRALVQDELQTYHWLVTFLWIDFIEELKQTEYSVPGGWTLEFPEPLGGRGPKRGTKQGENYLLRDAAWFYRRTIKVPRDSQYSIIKEHERMERRADSKRTVKEALKRTRALLAAVN